MTASPGAPAPGPGAPATAPGAPAPGPGAPAPGPGAPTPGAPTGAEEPERLAVGFARLLRRAGVAVPGGASVAYAQALAAVGLGRRGPVYWAGRATLVARPEDAETYDRVFAAYWGGTAPGWQLQLVRERLVTVATDDHDDGTHGPEEGGGAPAPVLHLRYSRTEVLRHKDFAACTPAELAEAQRLMATLRWGGARRPTRRRRPTGRRGEWPDLRRTVRLALRTGGEPIRRRWLAPGDRARRVVFLCDVSGSMAPYSRALLRFLHVAVAGRGRVEAFTMGTRLTRVTRTLSPVDPDVALAGAAAAVPDWSGGTRLGDSLRAFNDEWGIRGFARGAVVVILSDGWDRGDPSALAAEMGRLRRVAHRVVWVNPLKASPGYAPLVRGMAAALPYVDDFVEGHSVASLEALAALVSEGAVPGRRGRITVRGVPGGPGSVAEATSEGDDTWKR